MTTKVYRYENVKLIVKDRETLISLTDKDFEDSLDVQQGWVTNLYRLHEVDPTEIITLHFPTEEFLTRIKSMKPDTDEFLGVFFDLMDSLLKTELKKRNIDLDKLHYGLENENGIEYEYRHISQCQYQKLLKKHEDKWYKIICVVPYKQVHMDTFFVPQIRLYEFFNENIYKCYNGNKRRIVHIQPVTKEKVSKEISKVKETIKQYEDEKFRSNGFLKNAETN